MSKVFPKLEKLYKILVEDYFQKYSEKVIKPKRHSKKKSNKLGKKNDDINSIIDKLKLFCESNKKKDSKYSDLTSFSLVYINDIYEFLNKNPKDNFEAKYLHIYCLAYISLIGFDCFFTDIKNDDELFLFNSEKYNNYFNFIKDNSIVENIKDFYESNAIIIKQNYKNDINRYFYLIQLFDADKQYQTQLMTERQKANEIGLIIENSNNNKKDLFSESNNGDDSNTTKEKSGNKKSLNMDLKEDKNKNEKSNDNIINMNSNINNNDIIRKKGLNKIFQKQSEYMNDTHQINNKNVKNDNEINLNKLQISTNYLTNRIDKNFNGRLYNLELEQQLSKIQFYQLRYENIKIDFKLFKESAFNLANLKVLRNEKQYLQICIQSLKNIIKNLSNPYNFNFWTKLTNIILKNIFIILKKNNFTINQNKEQSIIDQIKNLIEKKRFDENINNSINKKITKYEEDLKGGEVNRTNIENLSSDEKRNFNLITIKKNNKEDITASLTIAFLFYIKEKEINTFISMIQ